MHVCSDQSALGDASFGFGLDGVHIEGTFLYLKCIGTRKKEEERKLWDVGGEGEGECGGGGGGRRKGDGGRNVLGRDATYLSIHLLILPYALKDSLGSCALWSNVSRKAR